LDSLISLE